MFEGLLMGLRGYRPNPVADLVDSRFNVIASASGKVAQLGGCQVALLSSSDLREGVQSGACFLVASGPSMIAKYLPMLKGRASFCVNGSIALFSEVDFGPTYYVCNDHGVAKAKYDLLLEGVKRAEYSFLSPAALSLLMERDPDIAKASRIMLLERADQRFQSLSMTTKKYRRYLRSSPEFAYSPDITGKKVIGFSKDVDLGVCDVRTVAYMVIQIAYSLGFNSCVMAGVDLGGDKRCYDEANPFPSYLEQNYEKYILPGFKLIAELASPESFQVFNLSDESRIPGEVIPRVSFEMAQEIMRT